MSSWRVFLRVEFRITPNNCFFNESLPELEKGINSPPKYDYCESNLNSFNEIMKNLEHTDIEYNEANFVTFVNDIKQKIDDTFLIDDNVVKKIETVTAL